MTLAERIVALEHVLAGIPHAFGGAIALAYYAEPRATIDIDLNLFVHATEFDRVREILVGLGASADEPSVASAALRDGQVRVMWDDTPLDLFFSYDAFHEAAASRVRTVPFAESQITILAVEHLIVCKVIFDRPKDWVDIDAIVASGTFVDTAEVFRWVGRIASDADPRYDRVGAVLRSAS
jgi:hypothetical protein